ncbi:hypothetical protein HU200_039864 [Digitaria exilis]|uniref:Leucine-rich repeat-containing N-terminal plant-type domain-containing protein n=1 Tax=Digitaria exilis TaxID=1010633 RepID=A0A835B7F5_9POAL|nr:hypothetical protein HU200_039864 [Digitaria exilis]
MMSCYVRPLRTMLCALCILQFVFYMASGCIVEERIALMQIKSSSLDANSLDSWGRSDDCCSWDRVTCNSNKRVSDLSLGNFYLQGPNPENTAECAALPWSGGYWNLNLTIFSSFQELQVLDLFGNVACIQNFEDLQGLTKLRYLNLGENTLIGNNILESLGKLAYLEVINIEMSSLSGVLQNIEYDRFQNFHELARTASGHQ